MYLHDANSSYHLCSPNTSLAGPKRLPWFFIAVWFPWSQLIHISQKDRFARTASHNLKMWGPLPVWGPDRTWGRMDTHGLSMVHGSEFELAHSAAAQRARRTSAGRACTPSCKLAFTVILSLSCFYACLLAFLLWPQGTLAAFSDGRGELPLVPPGPRDIILLIPTTGWRVWKLIQEANKQPKIPPTRTFCWKT